MNACLLASMSMALTQQFDLHHSLRYAIFMYAIENIEEIKNLVHLEPEVMFDYGVAELLELMRTGDQLDIQWLYVIAKMFNVQIMVLCDELIATD